jgi:GNAT superfamily N-acetyltransferase
MPAWKLVLLYRRLGLTGLLPRLARRAVATVYAKHTELVLVKRLDGGLTAPYRHNELRIAPVTPGHAPLLKRFNATHRTKRKVVASARYLECGYRGFLAFLDEELIGYWWWVSNETDRTITHPCVERFDLRLKDDEVFAFDYFIAPDYRAQGTAVKFLSLIYAELAALGYRGVWGSVDAANAPARWVYMALGNKVVRRNIAHEIFSSLLFQDRRAFIRNTRWNARHSFEHRLLFSLITHGV